MLPEMESALLSKLQTVHGAGRLFFLISHFATSLIGYA